MDVVEQAIQLGMALAASKEAVALREAEDSLTADNAAVQLLGSIEQNRQKMAELLMIENVEKERIDEMSRVIDDLEKQAMETQSIRAVKEAQKDFAALMGKVNSILKFYMTGETDNGGCGGNCGSCGGCEE